MKRTMLEAIEHRRSYYALSAESPIADERIEEILRLAVKHVPSPFNSQSTRVVLLLGENHQKLWNIVKETLRKQVSEDVFVKTEQKIDRGFAGGYGTVLFYEDRRVTWKLQEDFPTYSEKFPIWAYQTCAMHQFAIWTLLEDEGFGASLQHYNPLIDEEIRETWGFPEEWELNAQMPFGKPLEEPGEKEFQPLEDRFKIFR